MECIAYRSGYKYQLKESYSVQIGMRGSLVHDALYQLMRERHIDGLQFRKTADRLLQAMCREDGMSAARAWWVYQGVRFGGGYAADPASNKPLTRAPEGCQ